MKFENTTVLRVQYREMEESVSKHYGGTPYSVAVALETGNDTQHEVRVTGERPHWDDLDKIKQWQEAGMEGYSPRPDVILNDMCCDGAIPAGRYLINVCW